MTAWDAIVAGGGLVGGAIAFGLARRRLRVVVFDEGDQAFRAARGNFGLVTVQGKGIDNPAYHRWTRLSADRWAALAAELAERTGIDVGHQRRGAITPCLGEDELRQAAAHMERLKAQAGDLGFAYRMLDHGEVAAVVPGLGPAVVGGVYTPYDGQCSPLRLLRALHAAVLGLGGRYLPNAPVRAVQAAPGAFVVDAGGESATAPIFVLAAGLGSRDLAPGLGLCVPVRPDRGQIIVTERLRAILPMPLRPLIRQTSEGAIMLGLSSEDAGLDDRTTPSVLRDIAAGAVAILPWLASVRVVRAWAALRVMTPDEYPIYEQSEGFPGAFAAACHSGVTLAAGHALDLADRVIAGALPEDFACFSGKRFGPALG